MRIRMVAIGAAVLASLAPAAAAPAAPSEASRRRLMTEDEIARAALTVPADALARRLRSQRRLAAEGVPFTAALPAIEGEAEALRRPAAQILDRALALLVVAGRAEGLGREAADQLARELGVASAFTPAERAFIASETATQHERDQLSWRYEAALPLLWALGLAERLDKPTQATDSGTIVRLVAGRTRAELLAAVRLRPLGDILDEADMIYRYHWATVDARLHGQPFPAGLDDDVIMERHTALNWLIGYMDQPWDEVTTDT
jgi:Domain of unknown function (DUF4272)